MRISASRAQLWMTCARQAHLRYDTDLPRRQSAKASFGTIMHRCLQLYFESGGDYASAVDLFRDLWAHPEKAGVRPDYWPRMTSYPALRAKGLQILESLHATHPFRTLNVVGCEVPFLVPFGSHELNGFIDMLAIERSGTGQEILKVIDWKTQSKDPTYAQLALNVQLTIYLYAAGQRETWVGIDGHPTFKGVPNGEWLYETAAKMLPHRAIWYSLWNGKELDAGPRDQRDYERLNRVITEIERSHDAGIHIPSIGQACEYCDFVDDCGLAIPESVAHIGDRSDRSRWI